MQVFPSHMAGRTFGVELEFANNVDLLADWLCNNGMAYTHTRHVYHCGCEYCNFEYHDRMFKVQRDSSCGGEVISRPITLNDEGWRDFTLATDMIQLGCLELDIDTSLQAGMHVHVRRPHRIDAREQALAAFFRWEEPMHQLASGKFEAVRTFNHRLRNSFSTHLTLSELDEMLKGDTNYWREELHRQVQQFDRHGSLNVNTGLGTWEYRLWNATRAAWRMRANVLFSLALTDPLVVEDLLQHPQPDRRAFAEILLQRGWTLAAGYAHRQTKYQPVPNYPGGQVVTLRNLVRDDERIDHPTPEDVYYDDEQYPPPDHESPYAQRSLERYLVGDALVSRMMDYHRDATHTGLYGQVP